MTAKEASIIAKQISELALDILSQLKDYRLAPSFVENFYIALLNRLQLILRDTSDILNNNERQLTSAFILLRVLLDDFIRILSVFSSEDMEKEIVNIQADGLKHRFKIFEENYTFNNQYFDGNHGNLSTQLDYLSAKSSLLNNSNFDKYFIDKVNFKFKNLISIADVFKKLMKESDYKMASAHSYVLYKELTSYVHYSYLTYPFESEDAKQTAEIKILEEVLFYCFKMIQIHYSYFSKIYKLKTPENNTINLFN